MLFSLYFFLVLAINYGEDTFKDHMLITFLSLEFICSMLLACIYTHLFTSTGLVFPIPLVPVDYLQKWAKSNCKITYFIFTEALQIMALWFPVAFLHAFIQYAIIRVEVFVTSSPLEVYIELLFYLLFFICCFVVLNLPFYIEKPQRCTKCVVIIINLLNILTLFSIVSIAGFSTRYLTLTLSHSQDSDARLLIAVLPTVVAAVVAMRWDHIKKFVRKLHPQDSSSPRADNTINAGTDTNDNTT